MSKTSYLTPRELRDVTARHAYPKRKLTAVEQAIKDLWYATHRNPTGAADKLVVGNEMVSMNPEEILKRLDAATGSYLLRQEARQAVNDPAAMDLLVSKYPYVEFENVEQRLNPLQQAFASGVSEVDMRHAAIWLFSFKSVCLKLPRLKEQFFIGTPNTDFAKMRYSASVTPAAHGLVISAELQARINGLFSESSFFLSSVALIEEHRLDQFPTFLKRFGLEEPVDVNVVAETVHDVKLVFTRPMAVGRYSFPVLTAMVGTYPLINADGLHMYHFVL